MKLPSLTRAHGLASLKGLTYQRRNPELRKAVKALVNERLAQRTLERVQVSSGEAFILETGTLERPLPRLNNRMLILSPFDNSAIQRERLKALFQYDYQLECYDRHPNVSMATFAYPYFTVMNLWGEWIVMPIEKKAILKSNHYFWNKVALVKIFSLPHLSMPLYNSAIFKIVIQYL